MTEVGIARCNHTVEIMTEISGERDRAHKMTVSYLTAGIGTEHDTPTTCR